MSKELEQALIDKIKELTKLRHFYYKHLLVDKSCQIVGEEQRNAHC